MKFRGVTMQRLSSFLSVLMLASLLAGCAPRANAQSKEAKAVYSSYAPADLPENSETVSKDPPADCPITVPHSLREGNIHEMVSMNVPDLAFADHVFHATETMWLNRHTFP
jgi:hypothetical protein